MNACFEMQLKIQEQKSETKKTFEQLYYNLDFHGSGTKSLQYNQSITHFPPVICVVNLIQQHQTLLKILPINKNETNLKGIYSI